jgi:hypothetical protein
MIKTENIFGSAASLSTKPHYAVVMTACFRPEAQFAAQLVRVDAETRERDYAAALDFWLGLVDERIASIIFIENTGASLEALKHHCDTRNKRGIPCEFISVSCNQTPPGLHYGYAEFRMIDEGLQHSRLYADHTRLIKATGRYQFPSISHLLDHLPAEFALAVDARRNHRFVPKPQQIITAPLILARRDYFERYIRPAWRLLQPPPPYRGQFVEDVLYDTLMPLAGQPGVILRWPVNCDPAGIGANGDVYGAGRKIILSVMRATTRRLLPNWWC